MTITRHCPRWTVFVTAQGNRSATDLPIIGHGGSGLSVWAHKGVPKDVLHGNFHILGVGHAFEVQAHCRVHKRETRRTSTSEKASNRQRATTGGSDSVSTSGISPGLQGWVPRAVPSVNLAYC